MTKPRCTICQHPHLAAIDRALIGGEARRAIATRENVGRESLGRHRAHIGAQLVKAAERRGERLGDGLLEQLHGLKKSAFALVDDAKRDKDGRLQAVAINQARETLVTEARFQADARGAGLDGMRFEVSYIKNWRAGDGTEGGERILETYEKADGFAARLVSTESLGQVTFRSPASALLLSVVAETDGRDAGATQQPEIAE